MEIIIGREPVNNRLSLSVGSLKTTIGEHNSVPNSVSRTHCKICVDDAGTIIVTNLKEENVTWVNAHEIVSKHIKDTDTVTLGNEQHPINVSEVIAAAKKLLADANKPSAYSLAPLEAVWDQYESDLLKMQIQQAKRANQQRLQGILSLCGTLCAFIEQLNVFRFVVLFLALVCAVFFFWQENRTGSLFAVKKNERDKRFQGDYVCPNPDCRSFKGNTPYVSLKNIKSCPVCSCKYTI